VATLNCMPVLTALYAMNQLRKLIVLLALLPAVSLAEPDASQADSARSDAPADPSLSRTYEEVRVDALVSSIHMELKSKKFDRAKYVILAAKKGNPKACNLVGWMFDNGVGVKKDSVKALRWFESCAKRSPLAAYNAGVLYAEGRGPQRNPSKMVEYFKLGWTIGGSSFRGMVPQLPIRLAYQYKRQKANSDAWEWAEKASDLDARHGKYLAASMLVDKTAPYADNARAISNLNAAMDAGSASAAALLAWSYATGRLTEKDPVLAHEHELIAYKIDARRYASPKYSAGLDDEQIKKAESMASNWRSTHRDAIPMDFVSTLDGTEKQFSGK